MDRKINSIVIHCAATRNGKKLGSDKADASVVIDGMHIKSGFQRSATARSKFNQHLKAIGYHFVIDTDGKITSGRALWEVGAHVKGHNSDSIGICLVGGVTSEGKNFGRYTKAQWDSLREVIEQLSTKFPKANILGHRDFIGVKKDCPCFDVNEWLLEADETEQQHLYQE